MSVLEAYKSSTAMHHTDLEPYKVEFIEKAMEKGVLLFGEFTLKSGRLTLTPLASQAFAAILANSRIPPDFDVLFGPAYKGISLAAITAQTLYEKHGKDKAYCYNRKEKKDHGEGGDMVGAPLKGKIVIIDDVLTSGKAIREAIAILKSHPEAQLVGIVQLVDRQERGQQGTGSTVQEVEKEFNVPVVSIIALDDIVKYMQGREEMKEKLEQMVAYRAQWGITPQ
ncbi:orotate phosphoribosyltransferase [Naganishia onofrii]|uniref:Orotate phosphoribosyltransferase n=1 Tax=Naganishia onofrii TaxID=1851511 RepID=A0ACC2XKP0_9TREE|nr:orotate phosphoribosyltransferase [Naganishia onofrii]